MPGTSMPHWCRDIRDREDFDLMSVRVRLIALVLIGPFLVYVMLSYLLEEILEVLRE